MPAKGKKCPSPSVSLRQSHYFWRCIIINLKEVALEELVARAQSDADDGASFTEICQRFNGLVMKYARQNHLAGIFEDAVAEGWLAVVEAVRNYDRSKGINFAGYADSRVKYAVWNFFKKSKRRWQREVPEIANCDGEEISILELMVDNVEDMASQVVDKTAISEQMQDVNEQFGKISEKQQSVLKLTVLGESKLREAALQLGITPQAVHNLQKRGLRRLRNKLAMAQKPQKPPKSQKSQKSQKSAFNLASSGQKCGQIINNTP